ncbi:MULTISPECIES: PadR family transcriptional regulator [Tatumella]|uniref:PadR family transcriptional regulator n=1 Tax=Tatumella punctata TaxID=399969 RepID=A0ABW1VNT8_9GAMM|nr:MULTISPECIES: PadR family transcriptional regulator [unclassified Tatumella]MBS0855821.1 PadR family transcriptional regulator [Tatumella sp. JGM16]MBS0878269.1 PadR family transcriptional regulator [Tatumella sp. JGM82]MBS0891758.1 PadR family transcriptional regulator [Tatumella sp. JGM94]MBS0894768.1 PadR family transcriptional regulator [Tatumella sp. JGM130]MBS0902983.1 PadR family transcriptional regulator [Tatumella sp. JGM100]
MNIAKSGLLQRRRREKILDAADIRLLILSFLQQQPAHGYELIKAVENLARGEYTPSPGIIYPALMLLEEMDAIVPQHPGAGRKSYQLTGYGQQLLTDGAAQLEEISARLKMLAIVGRNRNIPQIERAVHNLKMALHTRLAEPSLSTETLYAIIDALDDAARRIERS